MVLSGRPPDRGDRPDPASAYAVSGVSRAIRMRLYAAPTMYVKSCVLAIPRTRVLRWQAVVFIQPKVCSIRFRTRWLAV